MDLQAILNRMRKWGENQSPSTAHQFAVVNIYSDEREASVEDSYEYASTETRWFNRVEHRPYAIHAEAFLVGNPDQTRNPSLRVPYIDSVLGKLQERHGNPYLQERTILLYSNHEPCRWCKEAIAKAKEYFSIPGVITVGFRIPRNDGYSEEKAGVRCLQVEE